MRRLSLTQHRGRTILNVLGPTIEFLSNPPDANDKGIYSVMLGSIPAGGVVPLHSHADPESFYVLSGSVGVWLDDHWVDAKQGDFVQVPAGVKHAFRNTSDVPVAEMIMTTPKLEQFFREVGKPAASPVPSPSKEDLEQFKKVSSSYGYWNASVEENAAIGIRL